MDVVFGLRARGATSGRSGGEGYVLISHYIVNQVSASELPGAPELTRGGAAARRRRGSTSGGKSRRPGAHRRTQHGERTAPRRHRAPRPSGPAEVALMANATRGAPPSLLRGDPAPPPAASATASAASARSGVCRAPASTPPARRSRTALSPARRRAVDRSRPSRTRPCSPPSGAISSAPPGPARDIARSGPACACATAFASLASACCP